jgi:CRP-like cAMP-binding protein
MRDHKPVQTESALTYLPLFDGLPPEEIARMARSTREIQARKGDILFHQGEACSGLHLLLHGQAKLAFASARGYEKVVELVREGESFGEASLFMERPHIVFAQALADSRVLHVSKEAIFEAMHRHHRFACKMLAGMAQREHQVMADIEAYSLHSGKQRVINYLIRELQGLQENCSSAVLQLSVRKGVIASRLNLTQEHFSRLLHELTDLGLIAVAGKIIRIPSVPALLRQQYL